MLYRFHYNILFVFFKLFSLFVSSQAVSSYIMRHPHPIGFLPPLHGFLRCLWALWTHSFPQTGHSHYAFLHLRLYLCFHNGFSDPGHGSQLLLTFSFLFFFFLFCQPYCHSAVEAEVCLRRQLCLAFFTNQNQTGPFPFLTVFRLRYLSFFPVSHPVFS